MQTPKNQFSSAELKFSYTDYPQLLNLSDTYRSGEVLLSIWKEECQCKEARRYVLFLDSHHQFIAWKNLPIRLDCGYCAREIAGMALACNAKNIIFSHNRLQDARPNATDKILTAKTFELCESIAVEILDYLIITPNECLSYRAWLTN